MRPTLILCCLAIGLSSPAAAGVTVNQNVKLPESDPEILERLLTDTPKPDLPHATQTGKAISIRMLKTEFASWR